jgi:hypothetical protein
MICAIPAKNITGSDKIATYVSLLEAKTSILFDASNKIKKFSTPGCHKTQSVALWTNSIKIKCNSNDGEVVDLVINLPTLQFEKTYSKNNKTFRSLAGFCMTPTD